MATAGGLIVSPEIPQALWSLTKATLDRAKREKCVVDIRFSKFPEPYKRLQFGKHYVVGFSGWLKVDPVIKRIFLTIITPNAEYLYCDEDCDPSTLVKPSTDYEFSYDEAMEITLLTKQATVMKRTRFVKMEYITDLLRGVALHQALDSKCPNGLARAHVAHPILNRPLHPQGMILETVQKAYQASLYQLYKRNAKPAQLIKPCLDVLDALCVLHQEGILHCDVKMDNILIEKVGEAYCGRLTDFGLARRLGEDHDYPTGYRFWDRLAEAGIFQYFTDIYGMAITLGEILWKEPFQDLTRDKANLTVEALDDVLLQTLQSLRLIDPEERSVNYNDPKVAVHFLLHKIMATVIADDERLGKFESVLKAIEPAKRAAFLQPHHISLRSFKKMVQELYELVV